MPKTSSDTPEPDLNFEQRLEKLEALVDQLESGELPLADSLDRFQQGIKLSQQCQTMLTEAQQTIEKLSDVDNEDSAEPFEPESQ